MLHLPLLLKNILCFHIVVVKSNLRTTLKDLLNIEVVDIDTVIAEQGAKIRGQYKNFKAMEALQLATAIVSGCDMFFTNDKQLIQEKELPCMTMEDL